MPRRRPPDGVSLRSINRSLRERHGGKVFARRGTRREVAHSLRFGKPGQGKDAMIRKLKTGEYRLYSRKKDPKTGKRRNLGTFKTREAAQEHEKAVQFFKRKG
jgi:hypothetical protein